MNRVSLAFDRTTVTTRGQLTIPVGVRRRLGIITGTRISVDVNSKGNLVFQLVPKERHR